MTTMHNPAGEHDPQFWKKQMEEIARREAAKLLHDRNCGEDCGALIRIQEQLKSGVDKRQEIDTKINLLFTKIDGVESKINDLIMKVASGSTGIVAAVFLSIAGAVITKILKWW